LAVCLFVCLAVNFPLAITTTDTGTENDTATATVANTATCTTRGWLLLLLLLLGDGSKCWVRVEHSLNHRPVLAM
jgi:hypothetical protein